MRLCFRRTFAVTFIIPFMIPFMPTTQAQQTSALPQWEGEAPAARPLTLDAAIAVALKNAPRLQAANYLTEAAKQRVNAARAGQATQWEGVGGYELAPRYQVPQGFTARVALKKTLYDGGQTKALVQQAEADVHSHQAQYAAAQLDVILAVKQAFYDVLYYQQLARLKREAVAQAEGYVALAKGLFEKGQVPERDIVQAQAVLALAQAEVESAEGLVKAAQADLRSAMGLAWDAPLEITGALSPPEPLPDVQTFIEQAMRQHPALQQAQAEVTAAEAAVRVAESQRKPVVALRTTGGVQERALPPKRGLFLFDATVRIPLRDGGQRKAARAEAQAHLAHAAATLEQIKRDLERKVIQAWHLAQAAQRKVESATHALLPAQENLRLAEAQYHAGVGTLLGIKDAQLDWLKALHNRIEAIYAYRQAEAQLYHAAGLMPAHRASVRDAATQREQSAKG
ncbi:MAG: TolC family protein [Abditibacteriales bacterium]|nr:TolC family protein [Abditibacteriales bacterium]MDW8364586.1 TolC family protein [Abditibacteriales bacterium]